MIRMDGCESVILLLCSGTVYVCVCVMLIVDLLDDVLEHLLGFMGPNAHHALSQTSKRFFQVVSRFYERPKTYKKIRETPAWCALNAFNSKYGTKMCASERKLDMTAARFLEPAGKQLADIVVHKIRTDPDGECKNTYIRTANAYRYYSLRVLPFMNEALGTLGTEWTSKYRLPLRDFDVERNPFTRMANPEKCGEFVAFKAFCRVWIDEAAVVYGMRKNPSDDYHPPARVPSIRDSDIDIACGQIKASSHMSPFSLRLPSVMHSKYTTVDDVTGADIYYYEWTSVRLFNENDHSCGPGWQEKMRKVREQLKNGIVTKWPYLCVAFFRDAAGVSLPCSAVSFIDDEDSSVAFETTHLQPITSAAAVDPSSLMAEAAADASGTSLTILSTLSTDSTNWTSAFRTEDKRRLQRVTAAMLSANPAPALVGYMQYRNPHNSSILISPFNGRFCYAWVAIPRKRDMHLFMRFVLDKDRLPGLPMHAEMRIVESGSCLFDRAAHDRPRMRSYWTAFTTDDLNSMVVTDGVDRAVLVPLPQTETAAKKRVSSDSVARFPLLQHRNSFHFLQASSRAVGLQTAPFHLVQAYRTDALPPSQATYTAGTIEMNRLCTAIWKNVHYWAVIYAKCMKTNEIETAIPAAPSS